MPKKDKTQPAGYHQTSWWLYCPVGDFEKWIELLHEAPTNERWFMQNIDLTAAEQIAGTVASGGLWHPYRLLECLGNRIMLVFGEQHQPLTERVVWAYLQYLFHNRRLERVSADWVSTQDGRRVRAEMYKYRPLRYESMGATAAEPAEA